MLNRFLSILFRLTNGIKLRGAEKFPPLPLSPDFRSEIIVKEEKVSKEILNQSPGKKSWEFIWKVCKFDVEAENYSFVRNEIKCLCVGREKTAS